jgi:hypothetical protein
VLGTQNKMAAKKENTANNSNNTVTVDEETDFADKEHGEIADHCNDNKSCCVSNFSYIKPVPKSPFFNDMTPCTLAEYLSTQYNIQHQNLNVKQCALPTYLR